MQKRFLVEVSAKYHEWGDFKTLVNPVLVTEKGLQELFAQYGLDGERLSLDHGIDTFYSQERQYPFNRLLIMGKNHDYDIDAKADKLMVNLCSFVRLGPPQGAARDHSVNS